MLGGMAFEGPTPPGPPREGAPNGAALLQQKMSRQRQLALERQRSSARKQLGAGVIASASPMAPSFRAREWDQVLPDGLSLSPAAKKDTRALEKTAPSSPVELEVARVEPVRVKVDDALDGLAEELLLDERLPAKRTDLEPGAGFRDGKPAKPGAGAWGDKGRSLAGIEEDHSFDASLELPSMRAEGLRRKQQTLILGEEEQAPATTLTPNLRAAQPGSTQPGGTQPGKSWDLTVEAVETRPEPVRDRRVRAEGRSWWPFGSAPSAAAVEPREEVTSISTFNFD